MAKILRRIKKWFNKPSTCRTWEEEYLSQSIDRKPKEGTWNCKYNNVAEHQDVSYTYRRIGGNAAPWKPRERNKI